MKSLHITASVLAMVAVSATAAAARDQVRVVGSSTVFPYSQAAAENFANATGMSAPVVESTGTGGGMKIFCEGIGEGFPDMTGASRAMKKSEYDLCVQNGVTDVTEVLIGYDGLSIAVSRATTHDWALTEEQIYLALAAQVPVDGEWKDNPYKTWSDIDAALPATPILAYGPPPTSGTRDAFVELTMHDGCKALPFVKDGGFDGAWVTENCSRMRQDGPFVEAGENDNLIVQRLEADPNAVGIFGYSFLYENLDKLQGIAINGVEPNPETIASFEYGVARPIFVYIKNAHRGVIPGFNEFIQEFVSDTALAAGGYQQERGLTVLAADKLVEVQKNTADAVKFEAIE
ncbi:MAG: substrate-binding domain-containing protein [Pseudotabrizicola sp.]|uniref:substrate-binding domain-containing protein n=2 Tax=Pseudotabrizicola sp. TaxID=2939647 RepID=UPI002730CB9B|nr:substrate-binding domain-containing protein [Pseudotabrizicola sp.]MDP2081563.1 substrate-binding domain-containing protein [Pseudotabrizicola sp.]MDZ7575766.1 substrate-binding domain-containing protein [Pseudotabrizicola sp.]